MYIAPRKYPCSRSNFKPQFGQDSCMRGNPLKIDLRKILAARHLGHICRIIAKAVEVVDIESPKVAPPSRRLSGGRPAAEPRAQFDINTGVAPFSRDPGRLVRASS